MNFNPNVDDFTSIYPNVQPYQSRGYNRYYIAAAWNDQESLTDSQLETNQEPRPHVVALMKHISMLNLIDSLLCDDTSYFF